MRPVYGPTTSCTAAVGSMNSPAAIALEPKPTPVLRGSSTSAGITAIDAYMPTPSRNAATLVVHTARAAIIRMSTSGLARAQLVAHPRGDHRGGGGEQPERPGRAPAPAGRLAHRDQQAGQPGGHQRRRAPVDRRASANRRGRHAEGDERRGGGDDRERKPEQPVVGEGVEDDARAPPGPARRRCPAARR